MKERRLDGIDTFLIMCVLDSHGCVVINDCDSYI